MSVPIGTIFRIITLGIIPLTEFIIKKVRERKAREKAEKEEADKAKLKAECNEAKARARKRLRNVKPIIY